jgi:phosphate transport system permease protein
MAEQPQQLRRAGDEAPDQVSAISGSAVRPGDRIFRGLSVGASASVLAIMAAIAAFLIYQAIPALAKDDANFFTESKWFPDADPGQPVVFGIAAMVAGTIASSIIAMVVAVPIAIGIALFISFYAPRRLAKPLAYVVDLLAAVPSIVFGLWGFFFFRNQLDGLVFWLDRWFGWTGLFAFRPDANPANQSLFTAGLVLAIMILPIVSAISREVFNQVPSANIEAALALGATRWEMIRISVLPFGRAGVTSASILGLGRALGETLAVTLILTAAYDVNLHLTENGGITFASNIALKNGEAGTVGTGALIASGLVLFLITLGVNSLSQLIIRRRNKEA